MKVGFIGLGQIGFPIATRLSAMGWNRSKQVAKQYTRETGFLNITLSQMKQCDVVFLCLPSTTESGLFCRQLKGVPYFIDLSSGLCTESRKIASDVYPSVYIDSPISGGPSGAVNGSLTSMVGAKTLDNEVENLIKKYSSNILLCGDVGNGNAIKSVNNYLNVSHLMLASDALLGLKKYGIEPEIALNCINVSSGRSLQTEVRIPTEVLTHRYNYGFKLSLMAKDVLNAKTVLNDCKFYDTMQSVVPKHSDEDYTTVVKELEHYHKTFF